MNICVAFGGNMSHRQGMDFLRICNRHFNLSIHTVTVVPCRGLENTKNPWCERANKLPEINKFHYLDATIARGKEFSDYAKKCF